MQRSQSMIILLLMGTAIVLAAVLFVAVSAIQNRPNVPAGAEVVTVAGQQITLSRDASQTVIMLPEVGVPPAQVEQAATTQPVSEVVESPTEAATAVATVAPAVEQVVPTNTPMPPTAVPQSTQSVIFIDYLVTSSDTLYSIATRLDTSIALMAAHNIDQEDLIVNSTIALPVGNPAYCPGRRPYAVGEGDTVFSLAQRFNTAKEILQQINGLDANFSIQVAQILCIP